MGGKRRELFKFYKMELWCCQTVRHDTAFLQPEIETENLALIHSNFVRPQSLWLIIKD